MMFHAGGFITGRKENFGNIPLLPSKGGFAVVNVNYRLRPYPVPVKDAFCALGWIHHEVHIYGFDTERIVIFGQNAGGNLAARLRLIIDPEPFLDECPYENLPDRPVAGVVSYAGLYNFELEEFRPVHKI
jgi:acetyl esterase/lipase